MLVLCFFIAENVSTPPHHRIFAWELKTRLTSTLVIIGQLKKMGLIKPPPPLPTLARAETVSTPSTENKWKKQDFASLSSALSSLIPKSDGLLNGKKKGFTDFREGDSEWHHNGNSNGRNGKFIPGIDDRDENGELLMGDDLGRDARDALRERMKSEEEVRLEEELVGRVGRIKV